MNWAWSKTTKFTFKSPNERSAKCTVGDWGMRPLRVAVVGAESTGKTSLTQALADVLSHRDQSVHTVNEELRHWCEREGRTPQAHEQMAIAQQQGHSAQKWAEQFPQSWLLSDTTPLMTAVYSHFLFDDQSLYPMALAHQALYDITLVTGLDLTWVADGLQRDGPQVRVPVDNLVRQALEGAGLPYRVVYGQGPRRLNNALLALGLPGEDLSAQQSRVDGQFLINQGRSIWQCNECSDPACEHQLFTGLLKQRSSS
jgi:HTH-type transcriptional repressor of NAD biosynthesis genes